MTQGQTVASYASLQQLAAELRLDAAAYRRACEMAELHPDRAGWLRHIDRFLTALGALLIVAGITTFFAWNWADLGSLVKFALIQGGIVAAVVLAWRLGIDAMAGQAALLGAAFLVGVLLAVFGQVYQTGADPYSLFLSWAILILPWAIAGRQAGLWMLFQILVNLAIILYWTQVLYPPEGWWMLAQALGPVVWLGTTVTDSRLASSLFVMNTAALLAWEILAARGLSWMTGRWFPRLTAVGALGTVVAPTIIVIFAAVFESRTGLRFLSPLLFTAALAACFYYYQYRKLDLFILTCCLTGAILVVMSLLIRYMPKDFGSLLLLAVALIVQVAAAAFWLRELSRRWEAEP